VAGTAGDGLQGSVGGVEQADEADEARLELGWSWERTVCSAVRFEHAEPSSRSARFAAYPRCWADLIREQHRSGLPGVDAARDGEADEARCNARNPVAISGR